MGHNENPCSDFHIYYQSTELINYKLPKGLL